MRTLKNAGNTKMNHKDDNDMRPHYDFDYSKSKPNRFAEKYNKMVRHVGLAPDVADEFPLHRQTLICGGDATRSHRFSAFLRRILISP